MPFITNTKNDDFGHAQTQRDIEYLYMLLGAGETQINDSGMSQEIGDDGVDGLPLAGRVGNIINNIAADPPTYYLYCQEGNLLTTVGAVNYYGLKQPAASITTVPTVTPSAVAGACPDGLTRAVLVSDSGALTTVWAGVNLKPGAIAYTDYTGVLANATPFISRRIVYMPLVSDATVFVRVYLPWRV